MMATPHQEARRVFFERISRVDTPEEREAIVAAAMAEGIDLALLEEWLDWLDNLPRTDSARADGIDLTKK